LIVCVAWLLFVLPFASLLGSLVFVVLGWLFMLLGCYYLFCLLLALLGCCCCFAWLLCLIWFVCFTLACLDDGTLDCEWLFKPWPAGTCCVVRWFHGAVSICWGADVLMWRWCWWYLGVLMRWCLCWCADLF
jgi:amino acid permease